ncbi:MAG TPA: 5'-nucleotidase C-terminal domain-containing protein [Marmoricola sp.]|nr:5'-nucleotidase C-terminal domain-containing protein [Marmoricola sp.]
MKLELLHWNDVHGRYDALARLAARARQIRSEAEHPVLLLDGGDIEDASVELSALSHGVAGWRLLGAAGVDAAVVGNGGLLRYGPAALPSYAAALGHEPLACDLLLDEAPLPGSRPSRLLSAGGLRVGVVGATDFYPSYQRAFGLTERGRVTAIRDEAVTLRDAGADFVVLLSHCGEDADAAISWALRGAVDLIVGGHTHEPFPQGRRDRGVPMAHAGCFGQFLGRIVVEIGDSVQVVSMTLEEVPESTAPDPAVVAELVRAEADLQDWLDETVGSLPAPAPHGDGATTAAAELMLSALLHRCPADVGLLVTGTLEAGLPAGTVRRRDVYAACSSPGNPATAQVPGRLLRSMLLRGASCEYGELAPRVFRGRRYQGLTTAGARVVDGVVLIGDRELDDAATYTVTATDLELGHYGRLVDTDVPGVRLDTSLIMPEVLEAHLRG